MKHLTATLAALVFAGLSSLPAMADSAIREQAFMLYYSIPFDGNSRKEETHTFGFRVDKLDAESQSDVTFSSLAFQKPLMDMRFSHDGIQAWEFNGVNTLVQSTVYNAAAGGTETVSAIDWGLVAIGVIGVAALLENDDDSDSCRVGFDFNYGTDLDTNAANQEKLINAISKGCPV